VSVIDAATNTVTATISVGIAPTGVAVTPDGSKAYVANTNSTTVSVIDTGTNTVAATIPVGNAPTAFGLFIQPELRFAGTPARQTASATA
jgi:YVTN family beta-propeller protein